LPPAYTTTQRISDALEDLNSAGVGRTPTPRAYPGQEGLMLGGRVGDGPGSDLGGIAPPPVGLGMALQAPLVTLQPSKGQRAATPVGGHEVREHCLGGWQGYTMHESNSLVVNRQGLGLR
jgi:hypothetical protein